MVLFYTQVLGTRPSEDMLRLAMATGKGFPEGLGLRLNFERQAILGIL